MYEHAIVCCARWETPYIGEWIRYYDVLGFDRIYLYCNDDDPADMAAEVGRTPRSRADLVQFVHFAGQGQQRAMYIDALVRVRQEARWVTFLDVDEFLVLRGSNSIKAFMAGWGDAVDSIHYNWLNFGNSGFVKRPLGSVLLHYTKRENRLHQNTKHLSRVALLDAERIAATHHPFWHGLFGPSWTHLRRVTVLGDDLAPLLEDYPLRMRAYLDDPVRVERLLNTAIVNHYMIKSEEDFLLRVARGVGGEFAGQKMWQDQYQNNNYRTLLAAMDQAEDRYLHDHALSQVLTTPVAGGAESVPILAPALASIPAPVSSPVLAPPNAGKQPLGSLRLVPARNQFWASQLVLGDNGRARHAGHGSLASFQAVGDRLHVQWDDWPSEVYVRLGDEFVAPAAE